MLSKPPKKWREILIDNLELYRDPDVIDELGKIVKKAQKDYVYWDKFKHYPIKNKKLTSEAAWAYLKLVRVSGQENTPVRTTDNNYFFYNITKSMYQKLSYIDSNASGFLRAQLGKPSEKKREQLILSTLTEEAIASSQMEGANTSRKVAKEMLLTHLKPRTRSEQMIINNYQVMQRLLDWKDIELSLDMLLEVQANITRDTLDNEEDAGRLRDKTDDIHVVDTLTGESAHIPPGSDKLKAELNRLISYANKKEEEDRFVHFVVKASILHFWLGYLHPFVDGNGRTARAIFYWYLLRQDYWLFQYLSVSRIIKRSKRQYENAYLYSEIDDNDLSYFLAYKLKVVVQSIDDFAKHLTRKIAEGEVIRERAEQLTGFNDRQVSLLSHFQVSSGETVDIAKYKSKNLVAYETARRDLFDLEKKGYLTKIKKGKKYVFIPNNQLISRLLSAHR